MPQNSTNGTFKDNAFGSPRGNNGSLAIKVTSTDGLTAGSADIWLNTVTGSLNYTTDGSTTHGSVINNGELSFDGVDDRVTLPNIAIGTSITYEVWARSPTAKAEFVLDHRAANVGIQPVFLAATGAIQYSDSTNGAVNSPVGTFQFDNQWHHIAVVGTPTTTKIYYNGVEVASSNVAVTPRAAMTVFVGVRHTLASFFEGRIRDVRIWNTARTQAEIQANMNRQLVGNEAGLAGYWRLNEGSGTVATDSTANANNGTITGATWVSP